MTAKSLVALWMGDEKNKEVVYSTKKSLIVSWLNEAQLMFCDLSECLRGTWEPTIESSGVVELPDDFLREIKDGIRWAADVRLRKIEHPDAINVSSFGGTYYYSIWDGKLHVWLAAAGTPSVPYIKKPEEITVNSIGSHDLQIPTEYQMDLMTFLDAMWIRRQGDYIGSRALLEAFRARAYGARIDIMRKYDPVPQMRSSSYGLT